MANILFDLYLVFFINFCLLVSTPIGIQIQQYYYMQKDCDK